MEQSVEQLQAENAELRKQAGEMRADRERAWAARDVAYEAVKKLREALGEVDRRLCLDDFGNWEMRRDEYSCEKTAALLAETALPDPTDEAILAARDARVRAPLEARIAELETWYQRALGDAYYYDRARRELMHLKSTKGRAEIRAAVKREVLKLRPYSEWHEDQGAVLWFHFPLCEPGYFGDPLINDWPYDEEDESSLWYVRIDGNEMQEQWEQLTALDAETVAKEDADGNG